MELSSKMWTCKHGRFTEKGIGCKFAGDISLLEQALGELGKIWHENRYSGSRINFSDVSEETKQILEGSK